MTLDGTNSWVLRLHGIDGAIVVDPGPLHEGHLAKLASFAPIAGILVTHRHHDHVEGLPRFRELTGAPVIEEAPGIERLATPGHTADSACFVVSAGHEGSGQRAVLTGDTVLGRGTTVVAYPDGNLNRYLRSLELLIGLGPIPVLPGHGPALVDCAGAAAFYLQHRKARLEQVRAAVASGARTPQEIVEIVYAEVDRSVWFAAEMSVRAQLALLQEESEPGTVWLDTP
jgi:glyoxylase-like metal-dependent hydrolase (beta-lactamase superfamily II)